MTVLSRPHRGPETQTFGNIQPDGLPHAGTDYGFSDGSRTFPDVLAAAPGRVLYAGDSRALGWPNPFYLNPDFDRTDARDDSAGNCVVIDHGDGVTTYDHLESWNVRAGHDVSRGQRIGTTGDTGHAYGKHLHFEWIPKPFNFATVTYGRAAPPFATITTQGTTTKGLTMADVEKILEAISASEARVIDYLRQVLVTGYEYPKGRRRYGIAAVLEETQRRIALDDVDGPNK